MKRLIIAVFSIAAIAGCTGQQQPDLRTYALTHLSTPQRIISLKPNITEILFALGVGERVIGVTTWCDWPPEAKKLPKVADYININTETIITLKPDLVIGSEENSIKEPFKILESAGIKTLFVPFRTMEDLSASIGKIAEIVGKKEVGEKLVKQMKNKMAPQKTYVFKHLRTPSILMLVGHRPLVAAGPDTFIGEIIRLAGAENIITGKTPYPTINTEYILAKKPDMIIDLGMGSDAESELPDILKGKVRRFDISEFRAGPRIGEAINRLREAIK